MENESYVTLEIAKLLKQAGFNLRTSRYYAPSWDDTAIVLHVTYLKKGFDWNDFGLRRRDQTFSAPTLAIAQRWLREARGVAINVVAHDGGSYNWELIYLPYFNEDDWRDIPAVTRPSHPTYEDALEEALFEVISAIKAE